MGGQMLRDAYVRARSCCTDEVWFAVSPHAVNNVIYCATRQLDAERFCLSMPVCRAAV